MFNLFLDKRCGIASWHHLYSFVVKRFPKKPRYQYVCSDFLDAEAMSCGSKLRRTAATLMKLSYA